MTTDNQRTPDPPKLDQAMPPGTDEGADGRTKPRRSPAGPLVLGAVIVVALAVLLLGLPRWLPPADLVRPMASGAASAAGITLSANVQLYTPAMSSVQGITITARDPAGNPVKGNWSTSWGVFLGAVSEQDLIPASGEPAATLEGTARALWSFPLDSGDIPWNIEVTFTAASGHTATMALERDRERQGFVRVVQPLASLNLRVNMDGYAYSATRNLDLPMHIEAVNADGYPVNGTWEANYGFLIGGERVGDKGSRIEKQIEVSWKFGAQSAEDVPDTAEITFTALDGHTKTLHLIKDTDDPWALRIAPEELVYIPLQLSETHPAEPTPTPTPLSLPDWQMTADYHGRYGDVALDMESEKYPEDDSSSAEHIGYMGMLPLPKGWSLCDDNRTEATIFDPDDQPIGSLSLVLLDPLAPPQDLYAPLMYNHSNIISFQKLDDPRRTVYRVLLEQALPAASGDTTVTIASQTVFLTGETRMVDGKTYVAAYNLLLHKARIDPERPERSVYLVSNGVIEFITQNWWRYPDDAPSTAAPLTWDELSIYGVKLGSNGNAALDTMTQAIGSTPATYQTSNDAGGQTRQLIWPDRATLTIRDGKAYAITTEADDAQLPRGLRMFATREQLIAALGAPLRKGDVWTWGVGSNDNMFAAFDYEKRSAGDYLRIFGISLTE